MNLRKKYAEETRLYRKDIEPLYHSLMYSLVSHIKRNARPNNNQFLTIYQGVHITHFSCI